jgi:HlyD family secretion protein
MAAQLESVGGSAAGAKRQTVYRLGPGGKPEPILIRTGISDGRFTAVLEGELTPGEKVIVGMATARVETPQGSTRAPTSGPRGF